MIAALLRSESGAENDCREQVSFRFRRRTGQEAGKGHIARLFWG